MPRLVFHIFLALLDEDRRARRSARTRAVSEIAHAQTTSWCHLVLYCDPSCRSRRTRDNRHRQCDRLDAIAKLKRQGAAATDPEEEAPPFRRKRRGNFPSDCELRFQWSDRPPREQAHRL